MEQEQINIEADLTVEETDSMMFASNSEEAAQKALNALLSKTEYDMTMKNLQTAIFMRNQLIKDLCYKKFGDVYEKIYPYQVKASQVDLHRNKLILFCHSSVLFFLKTMKAYEEKPKSDEPTITNIESDK